MPKFRIRQSLRSFSRPLAAAALLLLAGSAQSAVASDLVVSTPTAFAALPGVVNGVLTVDTLTITSTGSINNDDPVAPTASSAGAIKIVVNRALAMYPGASITAENRYGSGNGGDISIAVGDSVINPGVFTMGAGAFISSRKSAGAGTTGHSGNILISSSLISCDTNSVITAGRSLTTDHGSAGSIYIEGQTIAIDGEVSARSGMTSGYCWHQPNGGGPISLVADNSLSLGMNSVVSSRGLDPGADLVHIEAFLIDVGGLVESTGGGSSIPDNSTLLGPCNRSGKPGNSAAGIEVWGDYVLVDRANQHGELNADIVTTGTAGRGWIDIFADGQLTVLGPITGGYAIHANGGTAPSSNTCGTVPYSNTCGTAPSSCTGGIIAVKCVSGDIYGHGLVISADSTGAGGIGGQVSVEANAALLLETAVISARGDSVTSYAGCGYYGYGFGCYGSCGQGSRIDLVSYTGALTWTNGIGDVRPTGTGVPASLRGVITMKWGAALSVPATTVFPAIGNPTTPSAPTQITSGHPIVPNYANLH